MAPIIEYRVCARTNSIPDSIKFSGYNQNVLVQVPVAVRLGRSYSGGFSYHPGVPTDNLLGPIGSCQLGQLRPVGQGVLSAGGEVL